MIELTSQEYTNLLAYLPNPVHQIQNRGNLTARVSFVKSPLNGAYQVTFNINDFNNETSGKSTRAEIEIIEFAINIASANPFWEPREPIRIKQFDSSTQNVYRF